MKHYIVRMYDAELFLIGPFRSADELSTWGNDPANNPDDDPRWQSIQLTDEQVAAPLRTVAP